MLYIIDITLGRSNVAVVRDIRRLEIVHKKLTQWFIKITDYAERLLEDHKKLDWPSKTITAQKNWIDKSVGGEICFKLKNGGL